MLQNLIAQAQQKPAELEGYLKAIEEAKNKLVRWQEIKAAWEAQHMLDVAKDKQFSNEQARKAEVARRMKETKDVQEAEQKIAELKQEIAAHEVQAERVRMEFKATITLLQLAAAAIQAGNQEVLAMLNSNGSEKAKNGEAKDNGTEMVVKILGAMPTGKGTTVKALAENGDGKVDIYADGEVGTRIARSIGDTLKVKVKKLNKGYWVKEVVV